MSRDDPSPIVAACEKEMARLLGNRSDRRRFLKIMKLSKHASEIERLFAEDRTSSFKNVKVDDALDLRKRLATLSGPWIMHPMFCILGDFPTRLSVNEVGHLHSDKGSACEWTDGTRIYLLDGVQVGSRFVDDPESTRTEHLEKMTDAQRVVCFDRAPKREQVLFAIHDMEDQEKT